VLCSVLSSSALACKTPEVTPVPSEPVRLYIHLGAGSDVLDNGNTTFRVPFKVYENPTVYEWESVQGFKIYDGETHIRITVRGTLGRS